MILYFSGTGNTKFVAEYLSEADFLRSAGSKENANRGV